MEYIFKGTELVHNGDTYITGLADGRHSLKLDSNNDVYLDGGYVGVATQTTLDLFASFGLQINKTSRTAFDKAYYNPLEVQEYYQRKVRVEPKCECGAKHTSRVNYHSDYCPLYKK